MATKDPVIKRASVFIMNLQRISKIVITKK
jgi:hypothetical protein